MALHHSETTESVPLQVLPDTRMGASAAEDPPLPDKEVPSSQLQRRSSQCVGEGVCEPLLGAEVGGRA